MDEGRLECAGREVIIVSRWVNVVKESSMLYTPDRQTSRVNFLAPQSLLWLGGSDFIILHWVIDYHERHELRSTYGEQ